MSQPIATVAEVGSVQAVTRRQIRGSTLLLVGRLLSRVSNFVVQIVIVRYLAKSDYGAFAYGLSIVAIGETVVTFGLDRAVTRFVPMFHEQGEYRKAMGTLVFVLGSMVTLGLATILIVYGLQGVLGERVIGDQQAMAILLILIFLSPIQAIDTILVGVFAVFSNPRAIFVRRHVVAPGLKLAAVLAFVMSGSTVRFLAVGYLTAGILGTLVSLALLRQVMREQELMRVGLGAIVVPWRTILAFTVPLLSSDLMYAVMHATDTVMLGYFRDTVAVADFRAVQPTAHLNAFIFASFGTLFTPQAARMFARGDREGINHLYWKTAIWIAILTFPVFALTFSLAEPVAVLLFGEAYRESGLILAILAFGYYFNAALGLNGLTLKVYGRVRYVVGLNLVTLIATVVANLILIPRYGALGAAVGTTLTLMLHNVLKQAGLRLGTGIQIFEPRYLKVYALIGATSVGLLAANRFGGWPIAVNLALVVLASWLVVRVNRHLLDVEGTLPELLRLPLVARILGR